MKKKLNRFSTSSALNQYCLDQRQVDLLQDSQTKIFIYRRICRFTQIYQPSGTVTASSGGFFCFASDSVTTPVIIRAQATILIVVTVSPKSSTPQIMLVIGSKVVKIAAVEAPTCLMPICSSERATTVHSNANTVEINQPAASESSKSIHLFLCQRSP